jgi:hypothetical protein
VALVVVVSFLLFFGAQGAFGGRYREAADSGCVDLVGVPTPPPETPVPYFGLLSLGTGGIYVC